MKAGITRLVLTILLFMVFVPCTTFSQRIRIDGTKFVVNKKEIVMNGVNTPWDTWNDFGGDYNPDFWDAEFNRIKEAGGNCTRIWISCDGEKGILIDTTGYVSGATDEHWKHLDDLFDLARTHKIYIMATLLSFDHTKNSHKNFMSWRKMISNEATMQSYVDNYVLTFVERYKKNPYLWSIDACNEIEWINQDASNAKLDWKLLQRLVAHMAVAVHLKSEILFTVGSAAVKWNCDLGKPFEGNFWSDDNLQKTFPSPLARLDFYSPHFYGWVVKWFGNFCTDKSPSSFGLDDRPCMVGENPASGVFSQLETGKDSLAIPMQYAYIKAYENGWKGLLGWTSNGVDQCGTLDECSQGLQAFKEKYPQLINP